jgi:hypothetical protein
VNLIYIDPPFDSGADYVRKVSLRGPKGAASLAGETYTLGEQIQYTEGASEADHPMLLQPRRPRPRLFPRFGDDGGGGAEAGAALDRL